MTLSKLYRAFGIPPKRIIIIEKSSEIQYTYVQDGIRYFEWNFFKKIYEGEKNYRYRELKHFPQDIKYFTLDYIMLGLDNGYLRAVA